MINTCTLASSFTHTILLHQEYHQQECFKEMTVKITAHVYIIFKETFLKSEENNLKIFYKWYRVWESITQMLQLLERWSVGRVERKGMLPVISEELTLFINTVCNISFLPISEVLWNPNPTLRNFGALALCHTCSLSSSFEWGWSWGS